jgi:hypothetical protein
MRVIGARRACILGLALNAAACAGAPADSDVPPPKQQAPLFASTPIGTQFAGSVTAVSPSASSSATASRVANPGSLIVNDASTIWSIVYDPILGAVFASVNLPITIAPDDLFTVNRVSDGAIFAYLPLQKGTAIDDPSGALIADSASTVGLTGIAWVPPDTYQIQLIDSAEETLSTSAQTFSVVPPPMVAVQPYSGTNQCYGPAMAACTDQYNNDTQNCTYRSESAFWQCESDFGSCLQNACSNDQAECKSSCQSTLSDCEWTCDNDPACDGQCSWNASTCNSNCSIGYDDCISWDYPEDCSSLHNICRTNASPDTCLAGAAATFNNCKASIPICL